MARILVVDDEPGLREFLADALELDGHQVTAARDGAEAIVLVDQHSFDLVITDLKMPVVGGLEVVRKVCSEQSETQVIVLTAHGSVDAAVEAMKLGACDFLQKPIASPEELCQIAARAIERRQLIDHRDRSERSQRKMPPLTFGDPVMARVVEAIGKVARTSATVLLLGESGVGKEVAAHVIHEQSDRASKPFMAMNCAAVSENLLESELFGHEKGAFTGADAQRRGRIELAAGGSFFLDEIGELKLELQAKLLRVIQERTFERVGGTRSIDADVRWIAATNRDLPGMIAAGAFREDLYHRLAVFPIRLPPLRERKQDLLPIAETLLARISRELGRPGMTLSTSARSRLLAWHWPGNIRELANTLERAVILSDGTTVETEHLWLEASSAAPSQSTSTGEPRTLAELERDAIANTLVLVEGNRRRAAELLGIGERTLYDKIKKYEL